MTPSADPANAAAAETLIAEELLEDGEIVLLAVKPSGWFVLLVSLPVLLAAAVVAMATQLVKGSIFHGVQGQAVLLLCVGLGCLRVVLACFQWLGAMYILTNRRIMSLCGVFRSRVLQSRLKHITRLVLTQRFTEKPLALGSLFFEVADGDLPCQSWTCLARPEELEQIVRQAIRRAQ